jgi:peptidoglycan/xylan/chitin deacetylase (PgdA/CDA1 family)
VRRLILIFAVIAPVITVVLWSTSIFAAIGVLMLSHALLLYPTLTANAQWLGPVATHFQTQGREIWLTIDDGPAADTPAVLDLLDRLGVKATFFVKGMLAASHPDFAREIVRRGHSLGNHSYSHPSATFWCLLPNAIKREIERCNDAIAAVTSTPPRWFRAPVGMKNPAVHPVLDKHGMSLVGWSARGFDSTTHDAERVVKRILPNLRPGAIVLLHQGRESSARIIERTVVEAQKLGYSFVIPEPGRLKTNR